MLSVWRAYGRVGRGKAGQGRIEWDRLGHHSSLRAGAWRGIAGRSRRGTGRGELAVMVRASLRTMITIAAVNIDRREVLAMSSETHLHFIHHHVGLVAGWGRRQVPMHERLGRAEAQ